MKPMKIEKRLELSRPVDQILQCQITNEIQYHTETDGIRALGSLWVKGQAADEQGAYALNEEITLDVLAPMDKLQDASQFRIRLHHYDARIEDRDMIVTIYLNVYGMKEERAAAILESDAEIAPASIVQPAQTEVQHVDQGAKLASAEEASDMLENTEVEEEAEEAEPQAEEAAEIEDLFDDAENVIVTSRYMLALASDTYAAIAQRYGVNEKQLIAVNHNKPLEEKTLVLLPL